MAVPLTTIRDFAKRKAQAFNEDADLGRDAEIEALDLAWTAWSRKLAREGVRLQDRDTAQEYRVFEQVFVATLA